VTFLLAFVNCTVGSMLLAVSLSKASRADRLAATLRELGFHRARGLGAGIIAAEFVAGILVILDSTRIVAALAVLGLSFAFAAAGTLAIVRRKDVSCACYGTFAPTHQLGKMQLAQTPLWLVAVLCVAAWTGGPAWPASLLLLAVALVPSLAAFSTSALVLARRSREWSQL
jgi:hypothetical protein